MLSHQLKTEQFIMRLGAQFLNPNSKLLIRTASAVRILSYLATRLNLTEYGGDVELAVEVYC